MKPSNITAFRVLTLYFRLFQLEVLTASEIPSLIFVVNEFGEFPRDKFRSLVSKRKRGKTIFPKEY